jgi:hypothetical protein
MNEILKYRIDEIILSEANLSQCHLTRHKSHTIQSPATNCLRHGATSFIYSVIVRTIKGGRVTSKSKYQTLFFHHINLSCYCFWRQGSHVSLKIRNRSNSLLGSLSPQGNIYCQVRRSLFSYLGHNAVLVGSKSYVFCFENGEEM